MTLKTKLLDELTSELLGAADESAPQATVAAGPELCDFSRLPDHRHIDEMARYFRSQGLTNPYFLSHQGFNRSELTCGERSYINFSGYNYLDLSCDPRVIEESSAASHHYGTAAGAARMVGGEIDLHRALERDLATTFGFEDCVATVGGYVSNVSTIGYLCGQRDLIVYDEYMHNSAVMGCVLSGARRMAFRHNDLDELNKLLIENRARHERVLILVEGAYSMDGDLCDLPRLLQIKRRHHAWLMVDEAHSLGVVGPTRRGVAEHFGIDPREIDIVMGTLSKSFASCGGFIGGSEKLVTLLRYFAPGFLLYSTGLSPANTAAARAAVRIMREEPERVRRLQHNVQRFVELARARGLNTGASGRSAVVPLMVGNDDMELRLMCRLVEAGVLVHAVIYPVVPRKEARLRFFLTASHTEEQLVQTLDLIVRFTSELPAGTWA
jgi:8-amino-7-oxononanoate synthase